jgi:hypothetical protein
VLSSVIPFHISDIRDMLKFIVQRKLSEVCPNVILLKIIMTVPVPPVSAERIFSKLKLIKTHLRAAMAQERLTGLTILSQRMA